MKNPPSLLKKIIWLLVALALVGAYALSINVTKPDIGKLVTSIPKAKDIVSQLLNPDLITRAAGSEKIRLEFPVPCDASVQPTPMADTGPRITIEPTCANPRDIVTIKGYELGKNTDVTLRWVLPTGQTMSIRAIKTDALGNFTFETDVRPLTATANGVTAQIEADVAQVSKGIKPSQALKDVINAIIETIFMALLATTIGTILAVPLSFLAAANITKRGCIGTGIYYSSRMIFNVLRSWEPMVIVVVAALIVGFGAFAGVIALVIVTTASLGKMFSEAVENIDPGPIEALTATGANRLQVVLYAIVPQIVPDFLSYIIYHWDINVRISTVIGFVGGGGIGYYLSQKINTFQYDKAGTAIMLIIIVIWAMDFLSAEIRKRFI
jgi:phosphonate transport system permease protein